MTGSKFAQPLWVRDPAPNASVSAEDRFLEQRFDHRDDVELDLGSGSEVILADNRVLETELELDGSPTFVVLVTKSPIGTFHWVRLLASWSQLIVGP
jgi:hypothetical protein